MAFTVKLSNGISKNQAMNVIDGSVFARQIGLPLNRAITFNCSILNVSSLEVAHRFSKLSTDWIRTKGCTTSHLWVRENPKGIDNLHWTAHVPTHLTKEYTTIQMDWIRRIAGKYRKGGIQSQKIGIRPGERDRVLTDIEFLNHLERWIGYCLKGCDESVCDYLEIRHKPQGGVWGRRVGLSENISRKARQTARFEFRRRGAGMFPVRARMEFLPV